MLDGETNTFLPAPCLSISEYNLKANRVLAETSRLSKLSFPDLLFEPSIALLLFDELLLIATLDWVTPEQPIKVTTPAATSPRHASAIPREPCLLILFPPFLFRDPFVDSFLQRFQRQRAVIKNRVM